MPHPHDRSGKDSDQQVRDSCGCVFCDLDLPTFEEPDGFKRMAHWHHTRDGDVRCTRKS